MSRCEHGQPHVMGADGVICVHCQLASVQAELEEARKQVKAWDDMFPAECEPAVALRSARNRAEAAEKENRVLHDMLRTANNSTEDLRLCYKERDELREQIAILLKGSALDVLRNTLAENQDLREEVERYRQALERIASILPFSPADGFHCKQIAAYALEGE